MGRFFNTSTQFTAEPNWMRPGKHPWGWRSASRRDAIRAGPWCGKGWPGAQVAAEVFQEKGGTCGPCGCLAELRGWWEIRQRCPTAGARWWLPWKPSPTREAVRAVRLSSLGRFSLEPPSCPADGKRGQLRTATSKEEKQLLSRIKKCPQIQGLG